MKYFFISVPLAFNPDKPRRLVHEKPEFVQGQRYVRKSYLWKMKRFLPFIAIAIFLILIFWIVDFGRRPDIYIDEIRLGYKGVIVDKLSRRTIILKIRIENEKTIKIGSLCNELARSAEIGDEIEKIPNENYVLLKKDSGVLKLPYIYVSEKIRKDRRWPKEWKNKWLESTY